MYDTIPNMNKKTLFISDLHLDENHPKTTALFFAFLKQIDETVDALYILGDFFDVWIGDDGMRDYHIEIQQALKKVTCRCPIYFLPGNRDFLVGKKFIQAAGCILLKDPVLIHLYGVPTLLMHGDSLCIYDIKHQRFRIISQNFLIKTLFLNLPLSWRKKIAQTLRQESRKHLPKTSNVLWDIPESEVLRVMLKYDVSQMIHGHTHEHCIYPIMLNKNNKNKRQRIVLGDWENSGSIMVCRPQCSENSAALTENNLIRFNLDG